MSKGTIALIGLLAAVSFAFVAVVALVVWALPLHPKDEPEGDFFDIFWGNLMRTLDPGTMGADEGWGFRIAMLVVTLGGLVIVASLIGIVSGGFDAKIAELRKGRSRVIERDHTLILGWNDKVFTIVRELTIANASRGRSAIVILADRDKVEMEDALRSVVEARGSTTVICRTGDPVRSADLALGSPDEARSVILLAPDDNDDPDAVVIKTALAVAQRTSRAGRGGHLVAELRESSNLEAARLVGGEDVQWVLADELIGRITVQTCRGSGLSVVYSELLDFSGDEIYFAQVPELSGASYAEAQLAFEDSMVIGLASEGETWLNPAPSTIVEPSHSLIMIAEDDSSIRLGAAPPPDLGAIRPADPVAPRPERTIILGYNGRLSTLVRELDAFAVPGSTALVVADMDAPELPEVDNLDLHFERAQVTSRRTLDTVGVADADHVIVLADDRLSVQQADARTLITLLHLREIGERTDTRLNIVSEMLDDHNRELAEVTRTDDFIVSGRLVALMLAQLSENSRLVGVFEELFTAAGSELRVRPAADYVADEVAVTFSTVVAAAQRRGETAVGYRVGRRAGGTEPASSIVINPHKSSRRQFAPDDGVIVLARP
ncbi:MAG: CASTOR/POLLUX-related putative ion channel [Protaetiibacter sp.]